MKVLGAPEEDADRLAAGLPVGEDGRVAENTIITAFAGYCGVEPPDA